jgi:hypothetical protein
MAYPDYLDPVEREIIDRIIKDVLAAGHTIWVEDGEEIALKRSTDYEAITAEIAATCETTLIIETPDGVGHIWLIHGNGCDVVSDWTSSAEPFLTETF